jgi:hypothetical protein
MGRATVRQGWSWGPGILVRGLAAIMTVFLELASHEHVVSGEMSQRV